MNMDDLPKIDSLETLQLNIDTVRESGEELNSDLVQFVDDVYELASKLYMIVHKADKC